MTGTEKFLRRISPLIDKVWWRRVVLFFLMREIKKKTIICFDERWIPEDPEKRKEFYKHVSDWGKMMKNMNPEQRVFTYNPTTIS